MLHLLRMQAAALGQLESGATPEASEPLVLLQKAWQLQAELYQKVTDHRREMSIQGSTQTQEADFVFGKDEIANAKLTQRINQGVRYASPVPLHHKLFRFRAYSKPGPFRGSGKPMGKASKPYGGMSTQTGTYNNLSTSGHFFRGYRSPSRGFGGSGRGGYGSQFRGQGAPSRGKGKSARRGSLSPVLPQAEKQVGLVATAKGPTRSAAHPGTRRGASLETAKIRKRTTKKRRMW